MHLVSLHGRPGQGLHDELLGPRVVHRERLPKADDKHGRVLLVDRLVVQVDVVDELDRLGVVDGGPAHRHPQLELPAHLQGQEQPGHNPQEQVQYCTHNSVR